MAGTQLWFDQDRYLKAVMRQAEKTLHKVGLRLAKMMVRELKGLNGYPSEWRMEMISNIDNRITQKTDTFIEQSVGLIDLQGDVFAIVRAKILEHGTGSRGEAGNGAIFHWQGVPGLNKDVTGFNYSDKKTFPLPDEFNMEPGHWYSNACKLIDEIFDDAMDEMARKVNPLDYFKMR